MSRVHDVEMINDFTNGLPFVLRADVFQELLGDVVGPGDTVEDGLHG